MDITRNELLDELRAHLGALRRIPAERVEENTLWKEDLELDSLDLAEIAVGLEEAHGIEFTDDDLLAVTTVGQAIDSVLAKCRLRRRLSDSMAGEETGK